MLHVLGQRLSEQSIFAQTSRDMAMLQAVVMQGQPPENSYHQSGAMAQTSAMLGDEKQAKAWLAKVADPQEVYYMARCALMFKRHGFADLAAQYRKTTAQKSEDTLAEGDIFVALAESAALAGDGQMLEKNMDLAGDAELGTECFARAALVVALDGKKKKADVLLVDVSNMIEEIQDDRIRAELAAAMYAIDQTKPADRIMRDIEDKQQQARALIGLMRVQSAKHRVSSARAEQAIKALAAAPNQDARDYADKHLIVSDLFRAKVEAGHRDVDAKIAAQPTPLQQGYAALGAFDAYYEIYRKKQVKAGR